MKTACLGLGGNIGDPIRAMSNALRIIADHPACAISAVSRLYRTPPWGKTDQSYFFNACVAVLTSLEPEALLDFCLHIERAMKRERTERWGPRTLDIDILTYGEDVLETTRLTLPHPRMTDRAFVLLPLADFAADLEIGGRSVNAWLSQADKAGIEVVDNEDWWRGERAGNADG
ncbi:2-amino-4-hydroxy-6-hydroxymethyldihydropteridine diphosphokinase [Oryzifoliimicrobium ureilyticus]|uniref:2-amino-4-hydroxy-6- hydroxymethyldihydropteridine diphosphokinase n=1 Tax=Oryzifoliimicrobium ureilyticus TaxID=3113724 RepID=UPI003076767E